MEQAILNALSPEYPWRDRVHYLPEVDSTNDRLKILAAQGAPHGTAVIPTTRPAVTAAGGVVFCLPRG